MKVLHIVASLSAKWGGPTQVIKELAENIVRKGVEVSVFSPSGAKVGKEISNLEGVRIEVFKEGPFSKAWTGYTPSVTHALAMEAPKNDIIHIHEIWHYPHYAAYRAAKKANKPYIVTVHGSLDPWCLELKGFRKRIYAALIQRRILNEAAAIHALTEEEARDIQAFGVDVPIVVIPNGIKPAKFQALPSPSEIEKLYPELVGKNVLLFLGRIHPKKGLDNLAKAFGQIAGSRNDIHLLIVGPDNDNYREQVERFLESEGVLARTTFTGMLAERDKLAALSRADICAIPSYSEGMSIVVLEAMACGLPVVITRQCHFPEVAESRAGIVIEPNADQLADALNKLLDNPRLCKEMGENGRRLVMEKFTWDKIADQMIQLYEDILRK
jgi:glycosyltransferase involved in cell wall biosynthesis